MPSIFREQRAGAVAIVDAPVSRSYARNARVTFYVLGLGLSAVVSAVLVTVMDPARAVVLGFLVGGLCGFVAGVLVRVWPVLRVLWHWSAEIVLAGGVAAALVWAASVVGWPIALAVASAVVLVLVVVGPVRRRLVALVWCAVVRHRLRVCFAEFVRSAARVQRGRLPLLLWVRPTPAGERVWLWLRPGLDLSDLEERADKLAVACWASEVRVVRASARYAALIRVDVTRRDPLTGLVESPLAPPTTTSGGRASVPVRDWAGLDLPEVPEELVEPPRAAGRR